MQMYPIPCELNTHFNEKEIIFLIVSYMVYFLNWFALSILFNFVMIFRLDELNVVGCCLAP